MHPGADIASVCTAAGDRVPGPRSLALLSPVRFPWREAVDAIEEVGSIDSYALSMELSREGLVCGPSSGLNLKGGSALPCPYSVTDKYRSLSIHRQAEISRNVGSARRGRRQYSLCLSVLRSAVSIYQ